MSFLAKFVQNSLYIFNFNSVLNICVCLIEVKQNIVFFNLSHLRHGEIIIYECVLLYLIGKYRCKNVLSFVKCGL